MKVQVLAVSVLSILCQYVSGENDYCSDDIKGIACGIASEKTDLPNCNSRYGAFAKNDSLLTSVQHFARSHIHLSFQFLLLSSHYGNYEKNRRGFEKLYKKFSDDTWEKAIDLVKYLGKRGGHMTFLTNEKNKKMELTEVTEILSLGKALDMHKELAKEAHNIHFNVNSMEKHDAELASYLENNFVHQHSDVIRTLSGHTNDLKHLLTHETDPSLALYLFDEYLEKSI